MKRFVALEAFNDLASRTSRAGTDNLQMRPDQQLFPPVAARAADAAAEPELPRGFVDRDGARKIFGVTRRQWKRWVNQGTVRCGIIVPSRVGGRCYIFPIDQLLKLREELFARDTLYNNGGGNYHVPAGWGRRHETCRMLGVTRTDWQRWQSEGILPRGQRFDGGPMLYRVEELKKVLEQVGRLTPPYADPDGSGAYRVPLCGDDTGREAIIDAESLPLLDGAVLSWGGGQRGVVPFVSLCRADKPSGVALHRVIMNVDDKERQVGHVNGDPLDCRSANLFARTIQQRTRGARKMRSLKGRPCSSRFKGVVWDKQTKKWRANIVVNGKGRSLGRYADETAAALAYDEAARRWFGKYAWLNFPDGVDAALERDAA
jgi:hypothetical protein